MKRIHLPSNNVISSFRILKGNARISVMYQPMWGIPFMLFNFYLSLYMKELGITDRQLGYIISLSYICGTLISLVSGLITDRLGRRKATLIFDFISWPVMLFIYLISNSFALFALATIVGSVVKVVAVSWNLMLIEDADNEERIAAYNLLNIINIAAGLIIPFAGILVDSQGIIVSERIFLVFAIISMATMIIIRHGLYKETSVGQRILDEQKKNPVPFRLKDIIPFKAIVVFKGNTRAIVAAMVYILFFIYIPLGTFNSLYFAPYMTEVLGLGKSAISVLGGVYSVVMLLVFIFIIPVVGRMNNSRNMQAGLIIQSVSLLMITFIPSASLPSAILSIGLYAFGFGLFRPFLDAMLAEVSEGEHRASVYSLVNTITCIATAVVGLFSGFIYLYNPRIIYIISTGIILLCTVLLGVYRRMNR